jgi:hypothetical protein
LFSIGISFGFGLVVLVRFWIQFLFWFLVTELVLVWSQSDFFFLPCFGFGSDFSLFFVLLLIVY